MLERKAINAVDVYVGSRIRMRRIMLNMSQTALGDALGLTFQQVQKYEKGMNRVSSSRLQALADILSVSVSFFFDGAPGDRDSVKDVLKTPAPEYVMEFLTSKDGIALVSAFTRIKSVELRRGIINLVERIGDAADE
jgi:transcriptional regulator with XRE-family HTH domain